jgi:hypothetical protein
MVHMAADPRSATEQRWDPLARLAVKLLLLNVLCLTVNLALHGPGFWTGWVIFGSVIALAETTRRIAFGANASSPTPSDPSDH